MTGSRIPQNPPPGRRGPEGSGHGPFDPDPQLGPAGPNRRHSAKPMLAFAVLAVLAGVAVVVAFSRLPGPTAEALWTNSLLAVGGLAVLIPAGLLTAHFAIAWSDLGRPSGTATRLVLIVLLVAIAGGHAMNVPSLQLAWHVVTGQVSVDVPQLRVHDGGQETHLRGPIDNPLLPVSLGEAVSGAEMPRLTLSSPGGQLRIAAQMAHVVRAHAVHTRVTDWCLSACTLVFLAGDRPLLDKGGHLGFHRPAGLIEAGDGSQESRLFALDDSDPAVRAYRQALINAGAAPWFVERALTTPHDEMWFPTREELARSGLDIQFR
jgi:hypothetical protein